MKTPAKLLSVLFSLIAMTMLVSSCGGDDNDGPMSDPASAIVGEYVGTGKLELTGLGMSADTYNGMKVRVTRSSKEFVIVEPYYADGTKFFSSSTSSSVYKITQSANGDFMLTDDAGPRTKITITKKGHMSYDFPYVTVNNESGYSLTFEGDKQ